MLNAPRPLVAPPASPRWRRFLRQDSGATAIEYGLIAAIMSVAVIAGFTPLADWFKGAFDSVITVLSSHS